MANSRSNTVAGLVLSGGGALGAYEVGIIKALAEGCPSTGGVPLEATVFAGTSVGSYNSAILATNSGGPAASAKQLTSLWLDTIADQGKGAGNMVYRIRGDVFDYMDPRTPGSPAAQLAMILSDASAVGQMAGRSLKGFLQAHGSLISRAADQIDLSVMLDTTPFAKLVQDTIDPAALRASLTGANGLPPKKLSVTATSWSSGKARTFDFLNLNDEEVRLAIRASAAIPTIFPSVVLAGEHYLDGGVVANTPVTAAVREGANEIHILSLTPVENAKQEDFSGTTLDILGRVLLAVVEANIQNDLDLINEMNRGLEAIARISSGGEFDGSDAWPVTRTLGLMGEQLHRDDVPPQLTVHRYYPQTALGGIIDMLNFGRKEIEMLIERGYRDAMNHNCDRDCIIPHIA